MTATMAMITGRSAGQAAKRIGAARMSKKLARSLERKPASSWDDVVDLGGCYVHKKTSQQFVKGNKPPTVNSGESRQDHGEECVTLGRQAKKARPCKRELATIAGDRNATKDV